MTSSELLNLILARLVRAEGGSRQRWRRALGDVRVYSLATHPHCNWDLRSSGTAIELRAIEHVLDLARSTYPHVLGD